MIVGFVDLMAGRVGGGGGRVIGDYNVTQQIGTGSFAVVWKAHHKQRPGVVAIKEIATERLNKKLQESLKSEIDILQKANHPNIIKLHDIVEVGGRYVHPQFLLLFPFLFPPALQFHGLIRGVGNSSKSLGLTLMEGNGRGF